MKTTREPLNETTSCLITYITTYSMFVVVFVGVIIHLCMSLWRCDSDTRTTPSNENIGDNIADVAGCQHFVNKAPQVVDTQYNTAVC